MSTPDRPPRIPAPIIVHDFPEFKEEPNENSGNPSPRKPTLSPADAALSAQVSLPVIDSNDALQSVSELLNVQRTCGKEAFIAAFSHLNPTKQSNVAWDLFAALQGSSSGSAASRKRSGHLLPSGGNSITFNNEGNKSTSSVVSRSQSDRSQGFLDPVPMPTPASNPASGSYPGGITSPDRTAGLEGFRFGNTFEIETKSLNNSGSSFIYTPRVKTTARQRMMSRDQCGYEVLNDYTILDEIGSGAAGSVMLALHTKSQDPFAIKAVPKSKGLKFGRDLPVFNINAEVSVMKKLRHRNVVSLYEVIDDSEENMLYLVMDYVPNGTIIQPRVPEVGDGFSSPSGTLFEPIKDEEKLADYARQIIRGIRYLHRRNVLHRDIKPANILLSEDDVVKIADFGVSDFFGDRDADDRRVSAHAGTPAFLAPEVIQGQRATAAADVWAFGVTLYCMKFGQLPFDCESMPKTIEAIVNGDVSYPKDCSDDWLDLFQNIFVAEPSQRITVASIAIHPALHVDEDDDLLKTVRRSTGGISDDLGVSGMEEQGETDTSDNGSIAVRDEARVAFFSSKFVENIEKRRYSLGFIEELDPLQSPSGCVPGARTLPAQPVPPSQALPSPSRRGRRATLGRNSLLGI